MIFKQSAMVAILFSKRGLNFAQTVMRHVFIAINIPYNIFKDIFYK